MMWVVGLLILSGGSVFGHTDSPVGNCSSRCERLYDRSLRRVGYGIETVVSALRSKTEDSGVICWKFLDYDDCERQCEYLNESPSNSPFSRERPFLVRKCKRITAGSAYLPHFQCLHRFHTFLETRCSSYAKEAIKFRLRSLANETDVSMKREQLIQETCRHLHYHGTCLANAVFAYCPNADDLFNRFTLRDYFLSFVVPDRDQLFSDRLLDFCQLYDFQKMAKDIFDSTGSTVKRHIGATTPISRDITRRPYWESNVFRNDPITPRTPLFSSVEDLEDTPPNFFYSSAKYSTAYRKAIGNEHFYESTQHGIPIRIDDVDLITKPVSVDFSFEEMNSNGQMNRNTLSPILKITRPDNLLVTPRTIIAAGKTKPPNSESGEYFDDYGDSTNDGGPLFNDETPHIFHIRKIGDPTDLSESAEETSDSYEDSAERMDSNEIDFPGRRSREEAERSKIPSVADVIRTLFTTAFRPPSAPPNNGRQQSANTMFVLMAAYSAFFVAALLILIALLIALLLHRRAAERYSTVIIPKKTQKF